MQLSNENPVRAGFRKPILFYTHALVGGGAERVWAQTAAGLFERGYDVDFCVDWDAPENAHLLPKGMTVHRLGRNHLAAAWRLSRLLAKRRYFAAFSAVGASNLKLLAAKALSLSHARIVLSQHGHYEAEGRFLGRLGYRLTPLTSRVSAATVVVSDALKRDLIERFGAAPGRVVRIYNAIALGPADTVPSRAELAARPDRIVAVGRLVPEKGHMDLLKAMTKLPETASLTIAGEGPERQRLEAAAAALGLEARVSFPGYQNDLAPIYGPAKAMALPSHTEAFGNVVVEALGYGLPVVAADCGGPSEILAGGAFGAIVPVGDPDALAAALIRLLNDPGDPAARRARAEDYALDKILDEYVALLVKLGAAP
jgi:glycosyltransferase involved in cell wall biosynthesis